MNCARCGHTKECHEALGGHACGALRYAPRVGAEFACDCGGFE